MTFRITYWDTSDDNLVSRVQKEDIFKHTIGKCHMFAFKYARERYS